MAVSVSRFEKRDRFVRTLLGMAVIPPVLLSGTHVFAQTKIEQMVVTAQKRSQDIQTVPASISAFSGEGLESRQIKTLQDLTGTTPNFSISNAGGNVVPMLSMRGVSADGFNAGVDQPVALHIDGVYQPRTMGLNMIMTDLESVEVLRGPQGTLYGRNANAGVINLITAKPTDTFEGKATIFGGSYERYGARGYISGPIAEGISARLTGMVDRNSGWGKNLYNGHDIDASRTYGVKAAVRMEPTEDVTFDLSFSHTYGHTSSPPYINSFSPVNSGPQYAILVANGADVRATNQPWKWYGTNDPEQSFRISSAIGTIQWDITPDMTLKSITGWQRTKFNYFSDYDGMPAHVYTAQQDATSRSLSQEFNLSTRLWDRLDTVVGLYYLNDRIFNTGPGLALLSGSPFYTAPLANAISFTRLADQQAISRAAFFDATFTVFDGLRLLGGIRKTWDSKSTIQNVVIRTQTGGLLGGCGRAINVTPEQNYHSTTFRGGVQYDITQDVMGYVQWQNGFKTGGYNNGACNDAFEPEYIYSWEAGIKSTLFDGTTILNISVFDSKYSNMQMLRIIPNAAGIGTSAIDNAAGASIKGIEIEANSYLTDDLRVDFGAGILDATYGNGVIAANGSSGVNVVTNISGFDIPRAPKLTLSAGLEYTMQLGSLGELKSRGEYSYHSREWFSIFNEAIASQDGYSMVNAIFTFTPTDCENLQFQVYARNLLDKAYRTGGFPSGTLINSKGGWGAPRVFGAEVTAKF